MALLPDELHPIILSHIWDFALWRDARYVSRRWYKIIIETQPRLIWRFIRAGKLPNGAYHGYVYVNSSAPVDYYYIFQYDQLIAQEAFVNNRTIFHTSIENLIMFQEFYSIKSPTYRLIFLSPNQKRILEFCIDNQLNLYATAMNGLPITIISNHA